MVLLFTQSDATLVNVSEQLFGITKKENALPFGTEKQLYRVLSLDMENGKKGIYRFRISCGAHLGVCLLKFRDKISMVLQGEMINKLLAKFTIIYLGFEVRVCRCFTINSICVYLN